MESLRHSLASGGTVIIATFALDGPEKCSGLPVMRYDESSSQRELGPAFELLDARRETHLTPWRPEQRFLYACFRQVSGQQDGSGSAVISPRPVT